MSGDECLVGIDAGTSVVKAVAFDHAGNEVCSHERPFETHRPHALWVEQDMDELWATVEECTASIAARLTDEGRRISGIGITSTGDGTFLIDAQGRPVRNGILWCDGRSGEIVERWHAEGIAREAFGICGTSVFTGSQAAQLVWLREHEPEALESAATICHAKDWLFFKLTGKRTTDETDESLTMLRMSTRQYDEELFRIFGIEDLFPKFPPVLPSEENSGGIRPDVAEGLGLPADLAVVSGPMDVAACALGTGAIDHGQASTILGTAGIHQVIMERPILEPVMVGMTLCHGVKGRWIRMLAAMTATPNLDWFLEQMGAPLVAEAKGGDIYLHLEELISKVPAGSEVHDCFIGVAAYTYNYLLDPFAEMRKDALDWCEKASLCSQGMGSKGVGGPIAAAGMRDYTDPAKRDWLLETLVEGIREFACIAAAHGQDFVLWEPSPVGREMGSSIETVKDLYERFNVDSPIPVHLQIDVGHWCGYEQQGKDADLDAWLTELGQFSPVMHLQQMDGQADCHWSFSKEKNARGVIDMGKVLETLDKSGCKEVYMFPELAFPYEMDESEVLAELDESVEYLKQFF